MDISLLPALNAILNSTSAVLMITGHRFMHKGRIGAHRACMIAAVSSSSLFLISYVYYHLHAGVIRFQGTGWIRPVYFAILTSHTILAVAVVPLVLAALTLGLRGNFEKHRPAARWTYPIWLYVSITGVVIYFMVYHWFAPTP
jgi:putative membrane protein